MVLSSFVAQISTQDSRLHILCHTKNMLQRSYQIKLEETSIKLASLTSFHLSIPPYLVSVLIKLIDYCIMIINYNVHKVDLEKKLQHAKQRKHQRD